MAKKVPLNRLREISRPRSIRSGPPLHDPLESAELQVQEWPVQSAAGAAESKSSQDP